MTMPEAAVHENDGHGFGKDEIGTSWQSAPAEPVAKAHRMETAPQRDFRAARTPSHGPHDARASRCVDGIGHE